MEIWTDENGGVLKVTGNACARGEKYAVEEVVHPVRTLTTTVRVLGTEKSFLPVKTALPISKERMFEAMKIIRSLTARTPVRLGDVLGSFDGVDIVACRTITN